MECRWEHEVGHFATVFLAYVNRRGCHRVSNSELTSTFDNVSYVSEGQGSVWFEIAVHGVIRKEWICCSR
jgi:hypothetical protein